MTIPNLKRVRVSTEQELRRWLDKNHDHASVLLVTCGKKSRNKSVSSETVRDVLRDHGWASGPSYTLAGNLVGHVAKRA